MFGIIGLVMVVYGLLTGGDPMYQRSLGLGGLMLFFARRSAKE